MSHAIETFILQKNCRIPRYIWHSSIPGMNDFLIANGTGGTDLVPRPPSFNPGPRHPTHPFAHPLRVNSTCRSLPRASGPVAGMLA